MLAAEGVLLGVFPDGDGGGHVDVEAADDAELGYLDARVHERDELGREALLLLAHDDEAARREHDVLEHHAARRLLDAKERVALGAPRREVRGELGLGDLAHGDPAVGRHGDKLELLVVLDAEVAHDKLAQVEDLSTPHSV